MRKHKHKNKLYATLDVANAMDFRSIAHEMNLIGHKMGASRARLIMIGALEKIIYQLLELNGRECNDENVRLIAIDPEFQNIIAPFVLAAYGDHA